MDLGQLVWASFSNSVPLVPEDGDKITGESPAWLTVKTHEAGLFSAVKENPVLLPDKTWHPVKLIYPKSFFSASYFQRLSVLRIQYGVKGHISWVHTPPLPPCWS